MGIRETLNKNPQITTGVTAGIILLALLVIVWQILPGGGGGGAAGNFKRYYTTDTSSEAAALKAKFLDDPTKIPPFQKDGKDAVGVIVFSCDEGKTEKVAYFYRYPAASKKRMEDINAKIEAARKANQPPPPEAMMMGADMAEQEILLVGQTKWLTGQFAMKAMSEFKYPCDGDKLMILPQQ